MKRWEEEFNLNDNTRIVIRANKTTDDDYIDGIRFSVNYLIKREQNWICLARIDNHLHCGKKGLFHIHRLGKKIEYRQLNYEEAKKAIKPIGRSCEDGNMDCR